MTTRQFLTILFLVITASSLRGLEIRSPKVIIDVADKTGKLLFTPSFDKDEEEFKIDSIKFLETDAVLDYPKTSFPLNLTSNKEETIYFKNFSLERLPNTLSYQIFSGEEIIKVRTKVEKVEEQPGNQPIQIPIEIVGPIWAVFILTLIVIAILVISFAGLKRKLIGYTSVSALPSIHDFRNEMQSLFESKIRILSSQMEKANESVLNQLKKLSEAVTDLPQKTAHNLKEILDEREMKKYLEEMGRKRNSIQHKFDYRFKEIQNQPILTLCHLISDMSEKRALDMSSLPVYLQIGKKWTGLMTEWNQFLQEPELRKVEHLSDELYWARKIEEIITDLNSLPKEPPINSFMPLLEQIWKDSILQAEKEKLLELLKLEEVIPALNKFLDEAILKDYEIVETDGAGRHLYIKEVVAPGYRRKDNKVWVKKPKVKVDAK